MFRCIGGGVQDCGGGGRGGLRRWNRGDGGGAAMGSQDVVPNRGGGIASDQCGSVGIGGGSGGAIGHRSSVGETTSDDGDADDDGGGGGVSKGSGWATSGIAGFCC